MFFWLLLHAPFELFCLVVGWELYFKFHGCGFDEFELNAEGMRQSPHGESSNQYTVDSDMFCDSPVMVSMRFIFPSLEFLRKTPMRFRSHVRRLTTQMYEK